MKMFKTLHAYQLGSIILFFVIVSFSFSLSAQKLHLENLELQIDALVPKAINDSTPGLVVGVVKDGNLVFSKGYGMANLSYGIPNSPEVVYNIGSVTKQFLGLAYAMLATEGKLSLDDSVSKYMDEWPEFDKPVTLRNLLTHTSGYREAYMMSNMAGRNIGVDRLTRDETLEVVRRQPKLEFEPGSRYTYNSTAWVILAEILDKITGMEAEEWVAKQIFKPLSMDHTQIENEIGSVIYNAAESYAATDGGKYINLASNRAIFGAADIYSSINDLAKWIRNFKTMQVGGESAFNLFLDPFILNDGSNSEYGLGIGVSTYRGMKRLRHTGGHENFLTQLSYYPEQDLGIITITNFGGSGWLDTPDIADIILKDYLKDESIVATTKIRVPPKVLESYAGNYMSDDYNSMLKIEVVNDTLTINGRTKYLPISKSTFKRPNVNGILSFTKGEDGQKKATFKERGLYSYTAMDSWEPSKTNLESLAGKYFSNELETTHHMTFRDGKIFVSSRWIDEVELEPVAENIFTGGGYYVKFYTNEAGDYIGYDVNGGRTLGVYFEKI